MMKLMTIAAALALLLALATPTGATFANDVARHRQRRGAFCDFVKHQSTCQQKEVGSACTSDANCAIEPDGSMCNVNMYGRWRGMDVGKIMMGGLACASFFSMAKDEAACKAVEGVSCVWQANDDGKMGCTLDQAVTLSSITDPTLKKIMTISYKCEAIKDTAACGKDSDCQTLGGLCTQSIENTIKYTTECLASNAAAAGGTVAKGCAKLVGLAVDCGAKTKDTCTGNCEWKGDDNFCEGAGTATTSLMTSDADGQALVAKMMKPGTMPGCQDMNAEEGGTCKRLEATCSACTAKSDMCDFKLDGADTSAGFRPAYKCEDNSGMLMRKMGCGSQVSRMYKLEAQRNRAALGQLEVQATAAKTKVEAAKTKLAECTACANKAALEAEFTTAEAQVTAIAAASTKATADAAAADKEAEATKKLVDAGSTAAPASAGSSTAAPADATAVAKAAAAAAAKAYTAAGCNTDVAKDGCAELKKAKVAADAKVDLAEGSGASDLAVSIAAVLTGTIAAMFA